jgi:signal transduction histidine kinase
MQCADRTSPQVASRRPGRRFALVLEDDLDLVPPDDDEAQASGYRDRVQRVRELWNADRGRLAHYVVVVTLALFLVGEVSTIDTDHRAWLTTLALIGAAGLLLTRDAPFVAPVVTALAVAGTLVFEPDQMRDLDAPFLIVVLFLPWCLATYNERPRAIAGLVFMEAIGVWANIRFAERPGDYLWVAAFVAVSWATGFILSRRSAHARELHERALRLEREQLEAAERAVAGERQRIARELHDVIAHSVSVMTVQAGAVRRLLHPEQEREREALEAVEATGREALTEMRRLVGLLREKGMMPEFAPQPGMGTIDALLDGVRAAGLPVELEVEGESRELPAGVDLAAYRVIQESLTNALKYAGPAHAWVAVHWRDDALELEIANDGRSDGDGNGGGGHGLTGMRERVSLYGGVIDSGPRPGGGYVVRARLPLQEVA